MKSIKKQKIRKLYVIGVNYDKYYENELPKDFDGEVNRVFEDSVWQPTALSVYVDGSENVYTVAQKLSDMGYYVDNESIDSEAINRGIVSLMNVFYYGSFYHKCNYCYLCCKYFVCTKKTKCKDQRIF